MEASLHAVHLLPAHFPAQAVGQCDANGACCAKGEPNGDLVRAGPGGETRTTTHPLFFDVDEAECIVKSASGGYRINLHIAGRGCAVQLEPMQWAPVQWAPVQSELRHRVAAIHAPRTFVAERAV